jgi:DNA-directed RNA polymerase subunit RPC12/RpoP
MKFYVRTLYDDEDDNSYLCSRCNKTIHAGIFYIKLEEDKKACKDCFNVDEAQRFEIAFLIYLKFYDSLQSSLMPLQSSSTLPLPRLFINH